MSTCHLHLFKEMGYLNKCDVSHSSLHRIIKLFHFMLFIFKYFTNLCLYIASERAYFKQNQALYKFL